MVRGGGYSIHAMASVGEMIGGGVLQNTKSRGRVSLVEVVTGRRGVWVGASGESAKPTNKGCWILVNNYDEGW